MEERMAMLRPGESVRRIIVALVVVLCLGTGSASGVSARASATAAPMGRITYVGTDNQIHIVRADGTGDRALATRGRPYTPRWSPISGELVFDEQLSANPFTFQLSVIDPATDVSRVLVPPELRFRNPDDYFSYPYPHFTPD